MPDDSTIVGLVLAALVAVAGLASALTKLVCDLVYRRNGRRRDAENGHERQERDGFRAELRDYMAQTREAFTEVRNDLREVREDVRTFRRRLDYLEKGEQA